ncbi:MAG: hypothetical protein ABI741_04650 [Ferruginibacter sp.]
MLLLCIAGFGLQAQSVFVKTDRNQILIGERIEYELTLKLPEEGYGINFKLPDSIPHFDVVVNKNFDTVNSNGSYLIRKRIIFTSFDSGTWHIPPFEVLLQKNNTSSKLITDSILVNVGYSPPDSTNQLRDIKPVMEVSVTDYFWFYVAAAIMAAIILIVLLYFYFKNRKKKPLPVFHSALSAYDEAMKALQELKEFDLDKPEQIKIYHVTLSEIFKKYFSRKKSKNLLSKTTGDILLDIKEYSGDATLVSTVAAALRSADAVKFAKYLPAITESNQTFEQVKAAIQLIEKDQSPQKQ